MHIVIEDEDGIVRSVDVDDEVSELTFGSDPECRVYLPDLRVAGAHLRLARDGDGQWWLERCAIPEDSSTRLTRVFVNALEPEDLHQLRHNDEVLIARFRIRLFLEMSAASGPVSALMESVSKIREHPVPAGSLVHNEPLSTLNLSAETANKLTEFSFKVHESQDLAPLLAYCVPTLLHEFKGRQVLIGIRRQGYGRLEFVETLFHDGRKSGEPPLFETYKYRSTERGQSVCAVRTDEAETESALCVPLISVRGLLGMLYVDSKAGSTPYGPSDLDRFAVMGSVITRQLELIIQNQAKYDGAVEAGQNSFVQAIQAKLDPSMIPQWEGLQFAVYCKPGTETSGDVVDVMRMPNGLATVLCGHVSASPVRAAIAMAEARTAFRVAGLHGDPPHILLRALNWLLFDDKEPTVFDGVGVVMNAKTGAMQYSTAGSMGVAVIGDKGEVRVLAKPGIPSVGEKVEFAYGSESGRLVNGESMVFFTKGCLTAANDAGDCLGIDGFADAISDGFGQPASAAIDDLLSDLESYFRHGKQPDDITIVWIHRE